MNALMKAEAAAVTMTSLEMVEFINNQRGPEEATLRHDNFMAKVPKVLGEKDALKFKGIFVDSMNREKPCYRFPKREACLMAMSYSYELQAKVFDKMTALEEVVKNSAPQFYIPQTRAEALRLAADLEERNLLLEAKTSEQQAKIEELTPKAEAHDRFACSEGVRHIGVVAKEHSQSPRAFYSYLHDIGWIFRRGKSWVPTELARRRGYLVCKETEGTTADGRSWWSATTFFTPKGIARIAARLAKCP